MLVRAATRRADAIPSGCQTLAWQNTAYNQPPHPSFFIGGGMATAPRPAVFTP